MTADHLLTDAQAKTLRRLADAPKGKLDTWVLADAYAPGILQAEPTLLGPLGRDFTDKVMGPLSSTKLIRPTFFLTGWRITEAGRAALSRSGTEKRDPSPARSDGGD